MYFRMNRLTPILTVLAASAIISPALADPDIFGEPQYWGFADDFGTVPGELVPDIGLALRPIMGGDHQFLITLGMDWLGYIMTKKQYNNLLYIYFTILSVGPGMEQAVMDAYHGIFDNWPQ